MLALESQLNEFSNRLEQEYDSIFSLGAICQAAWQLKRTGLRRESSPFDWLVCYSLTQVARIFSHGFTEFMPLNRLEVIGQHENYLMVRDRISDFTSVHDFPVATNTAQNLHSYPEFHAKMQRRWQRIHDAMRDPGRRILFVRAFGQVEDTYCENHLRDEFSDFLNILSTWVSAKFHVLAVSAQTHAKYTLQDWNLPHLTMRSVMDTPGRWEGSDEEWDKVLNGISLSGTAAKS